MPPFCKLKKFNAALLSPNSNYAEIESLITFQPNVLSSTNTEHIRTSIKQNIYKLIRLESKSPPTNP